MTAWDPDHYDQFFAERQQPGHDLIRRIDAPAPERIVDLGCGTGRLTAELALRYPDAEVTGIDRSAEMISAARAAGVAFELGDIETFAALEPVDVLFANASLQWIAGHEQLFPRLVSLLAPGGTLAVQMPLSWDQPSHQILRDVGSEYGVTITAPPTLQPNDYHDVLAGRAETEVWVTTYYHVLHGENPVFRWVSATGIKRFLDRIDAGQHDSYLAECAKRIALAYPRDQRRETLFAFTRLFVLARTAAGPAP
ncbi:MAG: methyltransferase domain-containing protein [Acidimicrobiia bacterium]|nr:methyltransferase domain-containing protein [Acidimicrobiia bacterium]NNC92834.1 methyltransferase domain-containing protein [Acidimicrobiia bacterium]